MAAKDPGHCPWRDADLGAEDVLAFTVSIAGSKDLQLNLGRCLVGIECGRVDRSRRPSSPCSAKRYGLASSRPDDAEQSTAGHETSYEHYRET